MTTDRDLDRIATAWLADGPTEISDHAFRAVMTEVHATRQRRVWRGHRHNSWTVPMLRLGTVGVLVAAIAIVAVALLRTAPARVGTASPSPSSALASPLLSAGVFTLTGSMAEGHAGHTATLLPDGRVLIIGGHSDGSWSATETWDPVTGVFSPSGSLITGRHDHSSTLLPDGSVLVIGGFTGDNTNGDIGGALTTAELWDPATESFRSAGDLRDLWDPASGSWTYAENLSATDSGHPVTLLPDGRVLVGRGAAADIWDPATRSFGPAGSLADRTDAPEGTRLLDGRVLVIHGDGSATVWDPATGAFGTTGSLEVPQAGGSTTTFSGFTATLLPDGRVLVVGGRDDIAYHRASPSQGGRIGTMDVSASAEIWDPMTGVFSPTGSLAEGRSFQTATLLPDGRVLVVGGDRPGGTMTSAEVFQLR